MYKYFSFFEITDLWAKSTCCSFSKRVLTSCSNCFVELWTGISRGDPARIASWLTNTDIIDEGIVLVLVAAVTVRSLATLSALGFGFGLDFFCFCLVKSPASSAAFDSDWSIFPLARSFLSLILINFLLAHKPNWGICMHSYKLYRCNIRFPI